MFRHLLRLFRRIAPIAPAPLVLALAAVLPLRSAEAQTFAVQSATTTVTGSYFQFNQLAYINYVIKNISGSAQTLAYDFDCGALQEYVYDPDYGDIEPQGCETYGGNAGTVAAGASVTVSVPVRLYGDVSTADVTITAYAPGGISNADIVPGHVSNGSTFTITLVPPVARTYVPVMYPHGGVTPSYQPHNTVFAEGFTVTNTGNASGLFTFSLACTGAVTSCSAGQSSATIASNGNTYVIVTYTTPSLGGTGTVGLIAQGPMDRYGAVHADTGWFNINVVDALAPGISIAPLAPSESPTYTLTRNTSFTVDVCDDGTVGTPSISNNSGSASGPSSVVATTVAGCTTAKHAVFVVPLSPGMNDVYATVTDSYSNAAGVESWFKYDDAVDNSATISSATGATNPGQGTSATAVFTVTNTGFKTNTYTLTASCSYSAGSGCITTGNTSVTLAAGASQNVSIGYIAAGSIGAANTVTLTAAYAGAYTAHSVSRGFTSTSAWVDQVPPTIAFSITGGSTTTSRSLSVTGCDPDGTVATPTLTINGAVVSGTPTAVTQSGCTTAVRVDYVNVPYAMNANTLVGTVSDGSHTVSGTITLNYDASVEVRPTVTTSVSSRQVLGETIYTHAFTVANPGRFRVAYGLTLAGCVGDSEVALVINCDVPGSVWVDPGSTATVNAGFTTTDLAGTATLTLTAQSTPAVSSSASVNLTLPGSFVPSLSPKTSSAAVGAKLPATYTFSVTNHGNVTGPIYVLAACTNGWSCGPVVGVTTVVTGAGATVNQPIAITPGAVGSTSTMTLVANTASGLADTATVTLSAFDAVAPTIAVTPIDAVTATRLVPVSFTTCDADGTLGSAVVKLNGVVLSGAYSSDQPTVACNTKGAGSLTANAQPGTNTLIVTIGDGYHTSADTVSFRYDEVPEHTPAVVAGLSSDLRAENVTGVEHFTVRNPGTLQETYTLAASCGAGVTVCTSPSSIVVAPGATLSADVSFTTGLSSAHPLITLLATLTGVAGNAVTTNASTSLQVDATAPTVTLSPSGTSTTGTFPTINVSWCDAESGFASRAVTIDGVALPSNFTSATVAGCAAAGTSVWPSANMTLGSHTIVATAIDAVGHPTSASASVTLTLPPLASFQPSVSPKTGGPAVLPHATPTTHFVIQNDGSLSATYHMTPICATTTCSVDRSDVSIAAGARDSVVVSFNTQGAQLGAVTNVPISLEAKYTDIVNRTIADTGAAVATIASLHDLYQPLVYDPYGGVTAVDTAVIGNAFFTVADAGTAQATYKLNVSAVAPWGVNLFQFQSTFDTLVTLAPGQATLAYAQPISPHIVGSSGFLLATVTYVDRADMNGPVLSASAVELFETAAFTKAIAVTPKGTTAALSALMAVPGVNTGAYVFPFTVRSTGTAGVNADYEITCGGYVIHCNTSAGSAVSDSTHGTFNFGPVNVAGSIASLPISFDRDALSTADSGWIRAAFTNGDSHTALDAATVSIRASAVYVAINVSPDDRSEELNPGLSAVVERFVIHNTGTKPAMFDYVGTCSRVTTCPTVSQTVSIALRDSAIVPFIIATVGVPGDTGTVKLVVTEHGATGSPVQAIGLIHVKLATLTMVTVRARDLNPGPNITRGQCLTVSVGDDAAYECGDLRLVHGLPATRTMNRAFAPALIYNSRNEAAPLISAEVTLAPGLCPSSIQAIVLLDGHGVSKYHTYPWNRCDGRSPRRIVIPVDSVDQVLTGVYDYTLQVMAMLGDTAKFGTEPLTVAVVNRTSSAFGSGWWLDGLEQLATVPGKPDQLFWIAGDGSTRLYQRSASDTGVFVGTPNLARPDSIVHSIDGYRRRLANGAYVRFDEIMHHVETVSRTGEITRFHWIRGTSRLDSLLLPTASVSAQRAYAFGYTDSLLTSVTAPPSPSGARVTTIARSGNDISITDPGALFPVHFTRSVRGIVARTNRLADPTTFAYDVASGLLTGSTIDLGRTNPGQTIHNGFCPAEGVGLVSCALAPADSGTVLTTWTGPRGAVTTFALTQFGAPSVTTNALGQVTTLVRDNAAFPLLVTKTVAPNGLTTIAKYDNRARVDTSIVVNPYGNNLDAVTRYVWNGSAAFDLIDSLIAPMGEVTTFGYFPSGDREWQQDGRGSSSRTSFTYNTSRQVATVQAPATNVEAYFYNDQTGNLDSTRSPSNTVTRMHTDAIGRVDQVLVPIGALGSSLVKTVTDSFDIRDQTVRHSESAPAVPYTVASSSSGPVTGSASAGTLLVTTTYDDEGHPLQVSRSATPSPAIAGALTTTWTYDAAGRKLTEAGTTGLPQVWTYDPAGNPLTWTTRRNKVTTTTYDVLNRPVVRTTQSVVYAPDIESVPRFATHSNVFPYYSRQFTYDWQNGNPFTPDSLIVSGDTATFTYDAVTGAMTSANNRDAQISRGYYPNGALKSDTLRIGTVARTGAAEDFATHVYALDYSYDLEGRRLTRTDHLPGINSCPCTQSYSYDPVSGLLQSTTDQNAQFAFGYDGANRLQSRQSLVGIGSVAGESIGYDPAGRLVQRTVTGFGGLIYNDVLTYDQADHVVTTDISSDVSVGDHAEHAYSGMGALSAASRLRLGQYLIDEYVSDAMGNMVLHKSHNATDGIALVADTMTYAGEFQVGSAQDHRNWSIGSPLPATDMDTTTRGVDASGNLVTSLKTVATYFPGSNNWNQVIQRTEWTWNAYGADEKLRYAQRTWWPDSITQRTAFSEYRYDALGRRVLSRTRMDQHCDPSTAHDECTWRVERTVWDGDQILAEFRNAAVAQVVEQHPNCLADSDQNSEDCKQHWSPFWAEDSSQVENSSSGGDFAGAIRYTHAGGIDEPLAIWKNGLNEGIVPHRSWRGTYEAGSFLGSTPISIAWPARNQDAFHAADTRLDGVVEPNIWLGSIVDGRAEPSGLVYMRNRYYDPKAGRFTQEDPIGLAGGSNLYGFAGGDPVNHSDPFGLCPPDDKDESDCGSAYYARRIASGQGNRLVNEVAGAINACNESTACSIGMWGLIGGGLSKLGVSIGLSTAEVGGGEEALSGAERAMQKQFETSGRKSLEKTITRLTGRIAEHEEEIARYREAGGHTSSMEREIRAWKATIDAAQKILEKNP